VLYILEKGYVAYNLQKDISKYRIIKGVIYSNKLKNLEEVFVDNIFLYTLINTAKVKFNFKERKNYENKEEKRWGII